METVYEGYNLNVTLNDNFLTQQESNNLYEECLKLNWPNNYQRRRVNITFGDEGLEYVVTINGNTMSRKTIDWNVLNGLQKIKRKLERYTKSVFIMDVIASNKCNGMYKNPTFAQVLVQCKTRTAVC